LFFLLLSGCLPAFEPNQPDEECAPGRGGGHCENPKRNRPAGGGTIGVSAAHVLVGIHQIAVEAGGSVGCVARRLFCFELGHSLFELLIAGQQRLVARRVHVITMVVSPPGLVVDAPVEQPPPKQTAIRIRVRDPWPISVRAEDIIYPSRPGLDDDGGRDVRWRRRIIAPGRQRRWFCLVRTSPRRPRRKVSRGRRTWRIGCNRSRRLRLLKAGELLLARFLLACPRRRSVEAETRATGRVLTSAARGFGSARPA